MAATGLIASAESLSKAQTQGTEQHGRDRTTASAESLNSAQTQGTEQHGRDRTTASAESLSKAQTQGTAPVDSPPCRSSEYVSRTVR